MSGESATLQPISPLCNMAAIIHPVRPNTLERSRCRRHPKHNIEAGGQFPQPIIAWQKLQ